MVMLKHFKKESPPVEFSNMTKMLFTFQNSLNPCLEIVNLAHRKVSDLLNETSCKDKICAEISNDLMTDIALEFDFSEI